MSLKTRDESLVATIGTLAVAYNSFSNIVRSELAGLCEKIFFEQSLCQQRIRKKVYLNNIHWNSCMALAPPVA